MPPAPASTLPSHRLAIFERDPAAPLKKGVNPREIAQLDVPHEVTIPRRERAAASLVEARTRREPVEINHCPGGDLVALVLKG